MYLTGDVRQSALGANEDSLRLSECSCITTKATICNNTNTKNGLKALKMPTVRERPIHKQINFNLPFKHFQNYF